MSLRQSLRNTARQLWRTHKRFWATEINLSNYKRVFVVSPHADDETLGAGGLIAKACSMGIEVKVICINDGRFSQSEDLIDNAELVKLRKQEFSNACKILGVNDKNVVWLGFVQEEPFDDPSWIEPTLKLVDDFNADLIVLPDLNDDHPDHALIAKVLSNKINNTPIIYMPIWHIVYGPKLRPSTYLQALKRKTVYVDISNVLDKKQNAWANYETQGSQFRGIENWNYLDEGFSHHHMNIREIFFTNERY